MTGTFWYNRPIRALQTVLREADVQDYDVGSVIAYLKQTHANCIVINGGGVVDFFQSEGDMARPNRFLDGRDLLAEWVAAGRENDIAVILRVDFRGVEKERYDRHPDWFAQDPDGRPQVLTYNRPPIYSACYSGHYRNEYAREYIRSLMDRYDVDGIWHNAVQVGGVCYCPACRQGFDRDVGGEIPVGPAYSAPEMSDYRQWKSGRADRHLLQMRDVVKSFGESKAYVAEIFGMYDSRIPKSFSIDLDHAARHFDFLISVAFLSELGEAHEPGYSGSVVRFMKTLAPNKQAVVLFGTNESSHRFTGAPQAEVRAWLWDAVASGGGLWNTLFVGQHPSASTDRRNALLAEDAYAYLADNDSALVDQLPTSQTEILYSNSTRAAFPDAFGRAAKGVERVLLENHIPYTFRPESHLTIEALSGLELLILSDVACLSDDQIDVIENYVRDGGCLLATSRTSLFDEAGQPRGDFGLADLFGCTWSGETDTARTGYHRIVERSPVLEGFEQADLLLCSGSTLLCGMKSTNAHRALCAWMPPIPTQPPEYAWPEPSDDSHPTVIAGTVGSGQVIYFASEIDRLCIDGNHGDYGLLLGNAIKYLLGDRRMIRTNAPPSVRITLTDDRADSCTRILSLVNVSSAPYRPLHPPVPVHNITVEVQVGASQLIDSSVLRSDAAINISSRSTSQGTTINVELERLDEFAAIQLTTR